MDNELYKGLISMLHTARNLDANVTIVLKNYAKPEELSINFTVTEQGESIPLDAEQGF